MVCSIDHQDLYEKIWQPELEERLIVDFSTANAKARKLSRLSVL